MSTKAVGLAAQLVHVDEAGKDAHVVLVPLDRIENLPRPDELRMDSPEFKRLCDSIGADGLHQPVTLRKLADGLYSLVAGRHRAAAHAELDLDAVPAIIREDLDDVNAAVATAVENLDRKDLSPLDEAHALRDIQDAGGFTQTQLAARVGISQPVISKRLALLQIPEAIARLAGKQLRLEDAGLFKPLQGRDDLAGLVAKELEKHDGAHGVNLKPTLNNALCRGKKAPACLPFESYGGLVDSLIQYNWTLEQKILRDKTYRKDIQALEGITFKDGHNEVLVCLDVRAAKDAVERAKQRATKADSKKPGSSATASMKSPAEMRATRIKNKELRLQLEFMTEHLCKQDSFGEELVKHAYRRFLESVGQVASRKVDQEALARILGEYAPRDPSPLYKAIARGLPELVDKLWDTDRVVLDRYVAAVVHLHAGGYDHLVVKDEVLKFTTGKTRKQILAAAEAAVDGPKKAPSTPKAKKASTPTSAKNGAKKPASSRPAAKTLADVAKRSADDPESVPIEEAKDAAVAAIAEAKPGGAVVECHDCGKRVSTFPSGQLRPHQVPIEKRSDPKKSQRCEPVKRPGAAAGKECPACKAVVEKKGKGAAARLECFCTPEGGVPVAVVA